MREIASKGQLRLAFLRWAVVTVPLILLLGMTSGRLVPTGSENPWYQALAKPAFQPPDWAFPVAWTTLYVLLGLALAMVINARGSRHRGAAIAVFVVQLLLNLAWTPVFFGMREVTAALLILGAMIALTVLTLRLFARVRRPAGLLLVPYLLWLCYAGALTWEIRRLNPEAESLVPARAGDQIEIR